MWPRTSRPRTPSPKLVCSPTSAPTALSLGTCSPRVAPPSRPADLARKFIHLESSSRHLRRPIPTISTHVSTMPKLDSVARSNYTFDYRDARQLSRLQGLDRPVHPGTRHHSPQPDYQLHRCRDCHPRRPQPLWKRWRAQVQCELPPLRDSSWSITILILASRSMRLPSPVWRYGQSARVIANVDPTIGAWGRPQRDGPALRSTVSSYSVNFKFCSS